MKASSLLLVISLLAAGLRSEEVDSRSVTPGAAGAATEHRAFSDEISRALSANIRYMPPAEEQAELDRRELDKPQNQIIRLPRYVVEAKRPPVFVERNLYSKEMLRRLAYGRYVSSFNRTVLNRYRLPIIGNGIDAYAAMMYEADERQRALEEMDDRVSMYLLSGDTNEANRLLDDVQRTYMRRSDFGTRPRRPGD